MRIACVSDTHRMVREPESKCCFPYRMAKIAREQGPEIRAELYEVIRMEVERSYTALLDWLRGAGSWDMIIHLGDVTGGWQEQGCFHPSAKRLMPETKETLGRR